VRVPGDVHLDDVEAATGRMLAPYQENNMGDCPPEFMEFYDAEPDIKKDYEEDTTTKLRLADGALVSPWDKKYQKEKEDGAPFWQNREYEYPEGSEKIEVPNKELWDSWEAYAEEYGEYTKDEKEGKYGYWTNPNCKWDWWQIGGRWSGYFPVRDVTPAQLGSPGTFNNTPTPGRVDITRIKDLDSDVLQKQTDDAIAEFWKHYDGYVAKQAEPQDPGGGFNMHGSAARSALLSVGLIACKGASELTAEDTASKLVIPWKKDERREEHRFDVVNLCLNTPEEREAFQPQLEAEYDALRAYSYLDDAGWHQAGDMGWFGMSTDTPDTTVSYAQEYRQRVRSGDQEDWLVLVDCHI